MIAIFLFSALAALLVFLAGRRDAARDPRLTVVVLSLLVFFPLLTLLLPKAEVLPCSGSGVALSSFPWMFIAMAVWAFGSIVMAIRLALTVRTISRWRKNSELCERVEDIEVRRLQGLNGPVAAGVFKRVIFVPHNWMEWSDECRRIVLAHEVTHHHRRDPLWRWVGEIACVVHGGNPLVLWMVRRFAMQCEFACDATVLEKGIPVRDYARLLCDFAETRAPRGPVLAMSTRSSLECRVRRLLRPGKRLSAVGLLLLLVPTLAGAGALASLRQRILPDISIPKAEVDLRWSANPFPGEK